MRNKCTYGLNSKLIFWFLVGDFLPLSHEESNEICMLAGSLMFTRLYDFNSTFVLISGFAFCVELFLSNILDPSIQYDIFEGPAFDILFIRWLFLTCKLIAVFAIGLWKFNFDCGDKLLCLWTILWWREDNLATYGLMCLDLWDIGRQLYPDFTHKTSFIKLESFP